MENARGLRWRATSSTPVLLHVKNGLALVLRTLLPSHRKCALLHDIITADLAWPMLSLDDLWAAGSARLPAVTAVLMAR